jgi:MocE subfamily Rieske [2Fe-2S] domain protein
MSIAPATESVPHRSGDYSLVGEESRRAVERGLAEADWYQTPVPREAMRDLLERRDGPALRDTILWFGLLAAFGTAGYLLWPSPWCLVPFAVYWVIYGSSSDSRWHEFGHGTAFKTDWLNDLFYEIASFMVMRESIVWRWSHTRHHSDTIVVGRDPEIAVPRPPNVARMLAGFVGIPAAVRYFRSLVLHARGGLDAAEATFIPAAARRRLLVRAWVHLGIYAAVGAACLATRSLLPLMFIGLPNILGAWLMPIYGIPQHAGLAENVLDHRLNSRTILMNPVNRFLYWNMNYHTEHHMFPLVPYHALPRLHELVQHDFPAPYRGLWEAWAEIVPTVLRQVRDPGYHVRRKLPAPARGDAVTVAAKTVSSSDPADAHGWVAIGPAAMLGRADVIRFDHGGRTYAVYRTEGDTFHATAGICTHGNTHLAAGLVKGCLIECPKHNGRFDVRDGSPQRPPACVPLATYPVRTLDGLLSINIGEPHGQGDRRQEAALRCRVVSSLNVATFIRELVLQPLPGERRLDYRPGQYVQLAIPPYGTVRFADFQVPPPFDAVWRAHHVFDHTADNHTHLRRNYSLATNPATDSVLRFNVRIATPPRGQDCPAGVGSAYVWSLAPGDTVELFGPYGDFLIKETAAEMVYLGGGAGMAPLRSHLSHLFDTLETGRRVSFWYGARSRQELFSVDYFQDLARRFPNFRFETALSEPLPDDHWTGHVGFIHDVLEREHLAGHPQPGKVEYYLCGPPAMIEAARAMLAGRGIDPEQVSFDEF